MFFSHNVTFEILHPSHVKSYGGACKWVLNILVNRLETKSQIDQDYVQNLGAWGLGLGLWIPGGDRVIRLRG
ncbi:hypothetical protein CerSpe_041420 [Prunus speciosa]